MSIYQRKLGLTVKNRLEEQIESATQAGVEMVELLWNQLDAYNTTVVGVQELRVEHIATGVGRSTLQLRKTWIEDGELVFWPEVNSPVVEGKCRCYGYLADTTTNRLWLAEMIRYNKFTIVDETIRKQISALAEKEGMETTFVRDTSMDESLRKKDPKRDEILTLQEEKAALEQKLRDIETAKNAPPLQGITINKAKLAQRASINTKAVKGL